MRDAAARNTEYSDIPKQGWVDRWVPPPARPYVRLARFDRPIGTWLLLFPCWWSIALATPGWPSLWLVVLFGLGAMIMRGAGCCFNDITDRHYDAQVARTADRPLPSGQMTVGQAVIWMGVLCLLGLVILLQFNLVRHRGRGRVPGAGVHLPSVQAFHPLAPGRARPDVQLGGAVGLGGGAAATSRRPPWRSMRPGSSGRWATTPSMPTRTRKTTR